MADANTLEDLEIVAGQVWQAVGGVDQGAVTVEQVDPKRFGVEVAAANSLSWAPGEEGNTKQLELSTIRPFKPMDIMVVELDRGPTGTVSGAGQTVMDNVQISGVNQFTSKNPVNCAVFGTILSAPRPKIRFDTVQTSPSLTADMTNDSGVIAATHSIRVATIFGGVAVKR